MQELPGDIGGVIGGEEDEARRDLGGLPRALHRRILSKRGDELCITRHSAALRRGGVMARTARTVRAQGSGICPDGAGITA
jgi:hypothetical protein